MTGRPGAPTAVASRRRPVAALIAIVLTALTAATAAAGAAAASSKADNCTATSGVIVAVDFGHWGGPVLRFCAATVATGYALLNQGGWHTTGTEHDGPGFICRIGYGGYHHGIQYPTPRQEPCALTPPANAYWTYWQAGPGQDAWSYSQVGAMSDRPPPGSVELWVFGETNVGGTAGSAVPAIRPSRIRAGGTALASVGARQGTPAIVNAPPMASHATAGRGSPTPAIVTLVIVLLVAVVVIAVRRRTREER